MTDYTKPEKKLVQKRKEINLYTLNTLGKLYTQLGNYVKEHGPECKIQFNSYRLTILYRALETDKQFQKRLNSEAQAKQKVADQLEKQRAADYQQYLKLKVLFEQTGNKDETL